MKIPALSEARAVNGWNLSHSLLITVNWKPLFLTESSMRSVGDIGRFSYRYCSATSMGERVQLNILHPSFQDPALTVFPIKLALSWASFGYCFTQPAVAALKLLEGGEF